MANTNQLYDLLQRCILYHAYPLASHFDLHPTKLLAAWSGDRLGCPDWSDCHGHAREASLRPPRLFGSL
jgi:hypothetical protein